MKLVHKSLTAACAILMTLSCPAAAQETKTSPFAVIYDPSIGFKPSEPNLTKIFLQLADSLEAHGSPEPYIRHVVSEHQRIAALFQAKMGKQMSNHLPSYMTPEYVEQFAENWKLLDSKLKLGNLARSSGKCIRSVIVGPKGTGTMMVAALGKHQKLVSASMQTTAPTVGFDHLQTVLIVELELEGPEAVNLKRDQLLAELVAQETALSRSERKEYADLLKPRHFTRADFDALEHFYKGPYDKLSEEGKDEMSYRVRSGAIDTRADLPPEAGPLAQPFLGEKAALFKKLEDVMPGKAGKIETVINGFFTSVGRLAQTELELAIMARALK